MTNLAYCIFLPRFRSQVILRDLARGAGELPKQNFLSLCNNNNLVYNCHVQPQELLVLGTLNSCSMAPFKVWGTGHGLKNLGFEPGFPNNLSLMPCIVPNLS